MVTCNVLKRSFMWLILVSILVPLVGYGYSAGELNVSVGLKGGRAILSPQYTFASYVQFDQPYLLGLPFHIMPITSLEIGIDSYSPSCPSYSPGTSLFFSGKLKMRTPIRSMVICFGPGVFIRKGIFGSYLSCNLGFSLSPKTCLNTEVSLADRLLLRIGISYSLISKTYKSPKPGGAK